jgi:hypothetical protein
MNERILKLLAQTDIPQFPILGSLAWVATDHDMEKFAELIVKECASKADSILRQNQVEYIATGAGGGTMGDVILEHFGVES